MQQVFREFVGGITGSARLVGITGLGPPLVLKEAALDHRARYELSQEAEALTLFKQLGINTVPRIEGVGREQFPTRVFMEYVQGETIDQLANRVPALPLDGVSKVDNMTWEMPFMCIQLLQTLARIHSLGRTHQDLGGKPEHLIWANVPLPDGTIRQQLKIIDFANVVSPDAPNNSSLRGYSHDVVAAFGVILKHGFRLPIEEKGLESIGDWERKIQATGNQDLINVAAKVKGQSYKDAQAFSADMMPIFEKMFP